MRSNEYKHVSLSTLSTLQKLQTPHAKGKSVSLIWVKGYSGCEGNTIADKYAKQAITAGKEITTISDPKIQSKQQMTKRWKRQWKDSQTRRGRQYSLVQPLLQGRPWIGEMERTTDKIVTIIRLRFGHNRTPSHLHRTHLINQPKHKQHRENLYSAFDASGIPQLDTPYQHTTQERDDTATSSFH